jgi:hypothetical protein
MSGWFTDENGELFKFAGDYNFKSALPVGAVFASALPLTDSSVHALDGSYISQTGLYEQFAVYLKSLRDAGYKITCTQSEFNTSVSTYGQCGKFVIDDTLGTIRLPKITEFVASNNGGQEIGLAELDSFKSHNHTMQSAGNHKHSTSFTSYGTSASWSSAKEMYTTTASGKNAGSESRNTSETGSHTHTIDNTGGSETRPKNIRYPYYIVLISGFDPNVIGGGSGSGSVDLSNYYTKDETYSKQEVDDKLENLDSGGSKVIWEVWE